MSRKIPTLRTISSSKGGQQWGHTQVHYSDIVRAFLAAYAAGCRCRLKPERALYDRTRASRRNRKTRPGILLLVPLRNNSARPPDGAGSPPHHLASEQLRACPASTSDAGFVGRITACGYPPLIRGIGE
ncbi:hypothetical protein DY956_25795 [Pseudomonas paraeruginosa]|nr:hypothetical protein DY956_25795 [Pseudomonas paraeruginosa]